MIKKYANLFEIAYRLHDLLVIFLCFFLSYYFLFNSFFVTEQYATSIVCVILLATILFPECNVYDSWRGVSIKQEIWRLSIAWFFTSIALFACLFLLHLHVISRVWMAIFFLSVWVALLICHTSIRAFAKFLRQKGMNSQYVVIIGAGNLGHTVLTHLRSSTASGFKVIGFFDDDSTLQGQSVDGVKIIGDIESLSSFLSITLIDEVWLALPLRAESRMHMVFSVVSQHPSVKTRLVPDILRFSFFNHKISIVAGIPVLNLNESPMTGGSRIIKALEDRALALCILILISPIMLFIALAIKLTSKGPILFKQRRHGWDGCAIIVYKFRTMEVHEDRSVQQAQKNDPRVTVLGRFLRQTSLDELPQFINVLQGRMSIVGPRPHAIVHNEHYREKIQSYMLRHKVKPGITGWAQVNGWRGETDTLDKMQQRVEHDMYYIQHWSFLFDLKIIMLTILKEFFSKNAY